MLSGNTKLSTINSLNVIVTNMNAKEEFIQHTHIAQATVKCVTIEQTTIHGYDTLRVINLPVNHSPEDMDKFLDELNFDYDAGYGTQFLFGTIWYTDGTWSTRGEYDGQEWWLHHRCPEIYFADPSKVWKSDELDYWDGDDSDKISY